METNAKNYLEALIKTIPTYTITDEDKKKLRFQGISQLIYDKLTTNKFRTAPISEKIHARIMESCTASVTQNQPIHITIPFGGYKLPSLPSAPHIDWSEVFTCLIIRDYVSAISKIYDPGVIVEFYSDEIIVNRMNAIKQIDLDTYNQELNKLLGKFKLFLPRNVIYKLSSIRDHISQDALFDRFSQKHNVIIEWWGKQSEQEKKIHLEKAERNYFGNLKNLTKKEKADILLTSVFIHEALVRSHWDSDIVWAFGKGRIPVGFRYANGWGIQIKSSVSSAIQFWVGTGILQEKGVLFLPDIIGVQKFQKIKEHLRKVPIDIFTSEFPFLSTFQLLIFT